MISHSEAVFVQSVHFVVSVLQLPGQAGAPAVPSLLPVSNSAQSKQSEQVTDTEFAYL